MKTARILLADRVGNSDYTPHGGFRNPLLKRRRFCDRAVSFCIHPCPARKTETATPLLTEFYKSLGEGTFICLTLRGEVHTGITFALSRFTEVESTLRRWVVCKREGIHFQLNPRKACEFLKGFTPLCFPSLAAQGYHERGRFKRWR